MTLEEAEKLSELIEIAIKTKEDDLWLDAFKYADSCDFEDFDVPPENSLMEIPNVVQDGAGLRSGGKTVSVIEYPSMFM